MSLTHTCPCADCSTVIAADKAMCASHWQLVPRYLQDDMQRYWKHTQSGDYDTRKLGIHNYRVARDAALKAVAAHPLSTT